MLYENEFYLLILCLLRLTTVLSGLSTLNRFVVVKLVIELFFLFFTLSNLSKSDAVIYPLYREAYCPSFL